MAGAAGIKAGRAYVELGVDSTALERGLRVASNQVRDFGKAAQAVGQTLLKFGAVGGVGLAAGIKEFSDYEAEMARVRAITNAGAADFAMLGKKAQKLGLDTVFSAAQAASAMGNFAQSGLKVSQIMEATGHALNLAATAHIEIAEAASIATKVLFGMGLQVKDLGNVIDIMAAASTSANTDIKMLGSAFEFVGPVAHGLGIRIEEVTAAVQILSNAGIQGEMAGTAMRGMLLSLASPTEEAASTLQALGIRVNDARGNFLGIAPIIGQLERSLRGLGTGVKVNILGQIFPDRQTAAVVELVAKGAGHLAGKTRALFDVAGRGGKMAAIQLDTMRGALELLMSSLEGVGIVIGEALNPLLRRWGSIMVDTINTIALIISKNREFVVSVAKVVVGVVGVGAALIGLGLASKLLAFQLGVLRVGLSVLVVAFKLLAGTVWLFTTSISAASVATKAFSGLAAVFAALTSPLGLVVIGLTGLVAWLTYTGDAAKFLAFLGEGFKTLAVDAVAAFGSIADALKAGDIKLAAGILWAFIKVEWYKGINAVMGIWAEWSLAIREGFAKVSYDIASLWITTWHGLGAAVTGGMMDIKGVLATGWVAIKAGFTSVWKFLGDMLDNWAADSAKTFIRFNQRIKTEFATLKGFFSAGMHDATAEIVKINKDAEEQLAKSEEKRKGSIAGRDATIAGITGDPAAAAAARKKEYDAAMKTADKAHSDEQATLRSNYDAQRAERKKASDQSVADAKANLVKAQGELAALTAKPAAPAEEKKTSIEEQMAKIKQTRKDLAEAQRFAAASVAPEDQAGAAQEAQKLKAKLAMEEGSLKFMKRQAGGLPGKPGEGLTPEGLDKSLKNVSAKGTFDASSLQGMGLGEELGEKQVKEQKRTNELLTSINKKTGKPLATFA